MRRAGPGPGFGPRPLLDLCLNEPQQAAHLPVRDRFSLDQLPDVPLGDVQPFAQLTQREHPCAFSVEKVLIHANHSPATSLDLGLDSHGTQAPMTTSTSDCS